jgi:hypothetical protein
MIMILLVYKKIYILTLMNLILVFLVFVFLYYMVTRIFFLIRFLGKLSPTKGIEHQIKAIKTISYMIK